MLIYETFAISTSLLIFVSSSITSTIIVLLVLFGINFSTLDTNTVNIRFVSFIQNNLIYYNVSSSLNNFYNLGFLLAIFMILQIASGILISISYGFSFNSIIYILKDLAVGWVIRYMHSMNCSLIHLLLIGHILRGLYYVSYIYTPTIYVSGLVLYIIVILLSFLGYVLPYGQMSYWGATVITNILALIPNLMELLLGNFVMSLITLRRFYILHFVISLVLIVIMLVHIIFLHKLGSTNPMGYNSLKINFYPYFYIKDLYMFLVVLSLLFMNYFNFVELSHSDNNIEVNPLVTPLHIVPEWYFLSYYTILKCINSKVGGLVLLVSYFILLFNVITHNKTNCVTWSLNNLNVVYRWLSAFLILLYLGAKLPLSIYLTAANCVIMSLYFYTWNVRAYSIPMRRSYETYFVINAYQYYITAANGLFLLMYSINNVNIELTDSNNTTILLMFVVLSEALLFASFFAILFGVSSESTYVNHFGLYYIGLFLLGHASLSGSSLLTFFLLNAFITLQVIEYRNLNIELSYNVSTCLFFIATTLHLLHVLVGLFMVLINYSTDQVLFNSGQNSNLISISAIKQHEYNIVVTIYMNFVEALWLAIMFIYSFQYNKEYTSLNHKVIGSGYMIAATYCGLIAIMYSLLIRIELASDGNRIIFEQSNFSYNYLISLHGLMMIFFFVMPIVFASIGNIQVPININAAELKLSKLNNLSLLLFILSFWVVLSGSMLEFGQGVGWTLYPPLSTYSVNLSKLSLELLLIGLIFNGLASLLSSINFFISVFYMMNVYVIQIISLYTVAVLLASYMLILSLPVLTCGILSVYFDLSFNSSLMDPAYGGDPLMYQHLFWFFGHPEVYVMILPSFGIINNILTILLSKCTFGLSTMNLAMVGITFLGFVVWAHHIYTAGMESDTRAYFTAVTIMISIPTGTKIFNWLCNFYGKYTLYTDISIFVLFFLIIFVIGGVSGVMLGNAGLDIVLHDTYYVVGHFHQVLAIASVLSILTFIIFYQDNLHFIKLFSNINVSNLNFLFVSMFININIVFMNMMFLGWNVLPRRIPDYYHGANGLNMMASFCAIALGCMLVITI